MKKVLLPLVLVAISGSALADQPGFYIGGEIGDASTELEADMPFNTYSLDYDKNVLAYGIYAGMNFTENLGLEASLGQTGEEDHIKKGYVTLTPKIMLPLNNQVSLFAKGGVAYVGVDGDYSGIDKLDLDIDGFGWTAGAGVNLSLAEHLNVRGGVDYMSADLETTENNIDVPVDANTTIYYVGVDYKF